jgi:hypothetical protein
LAAVLLFVYGMMEEASTHDILRLNKLLVFFIISGGDVSDDAGI